ncbi:MAG: CAP domain-containing protein [Clostridiales bacterium]|nr:CAP domain-containing protein [Clostridiales bacterium]
MADNDTRNSGSGMGDKIVAAVLVFLIFGAGAYGVVRGLGSSARREETEQVDAAENELKTGDGKDGGPEDIILTGEFPVNAAGDEEKLSDRKVLSASDVAKAFNTEDTFKIVTFSTEESGSYRVDCDTVLYRFPTVNMEPFASVAKGAYLMVTGISEGGSWAQISYAGAIYYIPTWCLSADGGNHAALASVFVSGDVSELNRFAAVLFTPVEKSFNEFVVKLNTYAKECPSYSAEDIMPLSKGSKILVEAISDNGWAKLKNGAVTCYINMAYLEGKDLPVAGGDNKDPADTTVAATTAEENETASSSASGKNTGSGTPDMSYMSGRSDSSPKQGKSVSSGKSASESPSDKFPGKINMKEAKKLLKLVNDYRKENGRKALKWSSGLEKAAKKRAKEISLTTGSKDPHTRPNGKPWYTVNPDLMYGENLAYGQFTAEEVFNAWKNSKEHNKTMLEPGYKIFAAALYVEEGTKYVYFWTQEFGY